MKVAYENSLKYKMLQRINALRGNIVLRKDMADMANPRQMSKILRTLVEEERLAKLGYGVYCKLETSPFTGEKMLKITFLEASREALERLGVQWDLSDSEKAYNARKTTQLPVNPQTKIRGRFNRQLSYGNKELINR